MLVSYNSRNCSATCHAADLTSNVYEPTVFLVPQVRTVGSGRESLLFLTRVTDAISIARSNGREGPIKDTIRFHSCELRYSRVYFMKYFFNPRTGAVSDPEEGKEASEEEATRWRRWEKGREWNADERLKTKREERWFAARREIRGMKGANEREREGKGRSVFRSVE
ncbi:hypothetical protein DBV15_11166 [Temnothorax longispinosus]|uniref:Uncharacterized protein n=1 Tax=Temnothorax longispinosus TaxID=300112 RepID=A0A4S2L1B8_9HYME|nr:hypothetical protein DBV15_11166 [Temnothorax longispinosus]